MTRADDPPSTTSSAAPIYKFEGDTADDADSGTTTPLDALSCTTQTEEPSPRTPSKREQEKPTRKPRRPKKKPAKGDTAPDAKSSKKQILQHTVPANSAVVINITTQPSST